MIKIENRKAKFSQKGLYFLFLLSGNVSMKAISVRKPVVPALCYIVLIAYKIFYKNIKKRVDKV